MKSEKGLGENILCSYLGASPRSQSNWPNARDGPGISAPRIPMGHVAHSIQWWSWKFHPIFPMLRTKSSNKQNKRKKWAILSRLGIYLKKVLFAMRRKILWRFHQEYFESDFCQFCMIVHTKKNFLVKWFDAKSEYHLFHYRQRQLISNVTDEFDLRIAWRKKMTEVQRIDSTDLFYSNWNLVGQCEEWSMLFLIGHHLLAFFIFLADRVSIGDNHAQ